MQHVMISQDLRPSAHWDSAFGQTYRLLASVDQLTAQQDVFVWLHDTYPQAELVVAQLLSRHFPVVVISLNPQMAEAMKFIQVGALGYCHALATADMLLQVVSSVRLGSVWLGIDLVQQFVAQASQVAPIATTAEKERLLQLLTSKEQEVVAFVAQGLSNREVAERLHISDRTVKAHLSSIFAKLGIKDRIHLALMIRV